MRCKIINKVHAIVVSQIIGYFTQQFEKETFLLGY